MLFLRATPRNIRHRPDNVVSLARTSNGIRAHYVFVHFAAFSGLELPSALRKKETSRTGHPDRSQAPRAVVVL
jgi:hypothetical protein